MSLCVHVGALSCEIIALLNPMARMSRQCDNNRENSLECNEDFLVSNRHPHSLAILNTSRHGHRHLISLSSIIIHDFLRWWQATFFLWLAWPWPLHWEQGFLFHVPLPWHRLVKTLMEKSCIGNSASLFQHQNREYLKNHLHVLLIIKGPVETVSIPVPLQLGHLHVTISSGGSQVSSFFQYWTIVCYLSGLVPFSAPLPLQLPHVSITLTYISFVTWRKLHEKKDFHHPIFNLHTPIAACWKLSVTWYSLGPKSNCSAPPVWKVIMIKGVCW